MGTKYNHIKFEQVNSTTAVGNGFWKWQALWVLEVANPGFHICQKSPKMPFFGRFWVSRMVVEGVISIGTNLLDLVF